MNTFRQMVNAKVISRADAEKIEYSNLHIEPGFNVPGRTEENDPDDEALYLYVCSGGRIPDLEVRPREHGGWWSQGIAAGR